jgi:hypothetical protein
MVHSMLLCNVAIALDTPRELLAIKHLMLRLPRMRQIRGAREQAMQDKINNLLNTVTGLLAEKR